MKAVQALGILALLLGGVALAVMIYSCIGDSKGDRARLLPFFIAGLSLGAGKTENLIFGQTELFVCS